MGVLHSKKPLNVLSKFTIMNWRININLFSGSFNLLLKAKIKIHKNYF